jgi:hypothetical protein
VASVGTETSSVSDLIARPASGAVKNPKDKASRRCPADGKVNPISPLLRLKTTTEAANESRQIGNSAERAVEVVGRGQLARTPIEFVSACSQADLQPA